MYRKKTQYAPNYALYVYACLCLLMLAYKASLAGF